MAQPTIIEIPREAFDRYEEYAHGAIDRRRFFARHLG